MTYNVQPLRAAAALAAGTILGLLTAFPLAPALASGSSLPFHDTNAVGSLTFCNRAGQPETSGSLDTDPFAWKTVSSVPAPAGYQKPTSRATIAAYQPIKFVDPSDWSGEQLTGSSAFSNPQHPVVQATNGDQPMVSFVGAYPPHWQGLIQVRMLFSGVNIAQHIAPYPAAVIRITGNRWTLVSGGGSACSAGQGVSDETFLLPKKRLAKPRVVAPGRKNGSAAIKARALAKRQSKTLAASAAAASSSAGTQPSAQNAASTTSSNSSGTGTSVAIGVGVAAVLLAAIVAVVWRRRAGPNV